ncbi:MAG TPA: hypothetical protein VHS80_11325, partial [Chthoniobacterales bacterium]|nr:hypothetical protein [Chthoniobacterales bacterium]
PPNPFFIDTARGAWGIIMPPDRYETNPNPPPPTILVVGYDAAWTSFTGDGQLDPGQVFSTTVLFTPPGIHTKTDQPVEAVDFFAQSPTIPSRYDNFGHQVLGIYVAPVSGVIAFTLLVHTGKVPTDENPPVIQTLSFPFTGTASYPQKVRIIYTQHTQGHWTLRLESPNTNAVVLTSHEYGTTWNTLGVDGVRYFTSQGGTNPGGPLEWKSRAVSGGAFQ